MLFNFVLEYTFLQNRENNNVSIMKIINELDKKNLLKVTKNLI